MKEKFIKWFFFRVLGVQWIRSCGSTLPGEEGSNAGELGIRIGGTNFFYYKDSEPLIAGNQSWRPVKKREFGEVIRAMNEKNRAVFSMGMSGGIHRPN